MTSQINSETRKPGDFNQEGRKAGRPAIARAEELYRRHIPDRLFVERLALFLRNGFVHSAPELFAMGIPVNHAVALERKFDYDPAAHSATESPDAWYIDLAVGDLGELVRLLPFRLPFICFYRKFRSQLKVYPMERFLRGFNEQVKVQG